MPPAIWPSHPEIQHHLNFKPYIELDIHFDTKKMLEESFAVLDKFVAHRNYAVTSNGKSEWKSVGIQAVDGDYTKTSYHTNYGITEANYRLTEVADQCPETIKFLCSLTDLHECERVRFMLLEPGAKIHVHHDSDDDVCTAVNISLNMPADCRFVADANEDGSTNPYTVELPFKDSGSVILFNNSKYHFVENNSDKPRMHIIYHGPIRYPMEAIIADARRQNNFSKDREVLQALIRKKYELGETINPESELYKEWKTLGISNDIIPDSLKMIVVDETLQDKELQQECLYKITAASLFPLAYEVVPADKLDSWMADPSNDKIEHLIIIGSGLLINDVNRFALELFRTIARMKGEDVMLSGQIINQKNAIPYLHEQLLILDYQKWKANGKIPFGKRYENQEFEFPGYKASDENIHDDYTPLFIESVPNKSPTIGKKGWGTVLLAESLKRNIKVLNIPAELRETKQYAYPAADEKWQYAEIKRDIEERLAYINKQVFFFNNEELRVRNLEFQPDHFITVAAGFKPFGIYRQFWKAKKPQSIYVVDYSQKAIEYLSGLARVKTPTELFEYIKDFMKKHPYGSTLDDDALRNHLQALLVETFENDVNLLIEELQKLASANFNNTDFIQNPDSIVDLFNKDLKTLFWHSNAWNCNGILYKMTPTEIEENYLAFVSKIKDKLGFPAWKKIDTYEVIFGENIDRVHSFMTEGAIGEKPVEGEWKEL